VFAVLYDVISDSAVIVRFEEIDDSVSAAKLYAGDVREMELHGAGLWVGDVRLFPKSPSVG
jgi:hypothetical protein